MTRRRLRQLRTQGGRPPLPSQRFAAGLRRHPAAAVALGLGLILLLSSLVPLAQVHNSEDLWLAPGRRTDAYHRVVDRTGVVETTTVLMRGGSAPLDPLLLAASLQVEQAIRDDLALTAVLDDPQHPERSIHSAPRLLAQAAVLSQQRADLLVPIAEALTAAMDASKGSPTASQQQHQQISLSLAAMTLSSEQANATHDGRVLDTGLFGALRGQMQLALQSNLTTTQRLAVVLLVLAGLRLASATSGPDALPTDDRGRARLADLLAALDDILVTGAPLADRQQALVVATRGVDLGERDLALRSGAATFGTPGLGELVGALSAALGSANATDAPTTLMFGSSALRTIETADRLGHAADPGIAGGLQGMDRALGDLAALRHVEALRTALEVELLLLRTLLEMGARGPDLSMPSSNETFNAYAQRLWEVGAVLQEAEVDPATAVVEVEQLQEWTAGIIFVNTELNRLGLFPEPEAFAPMLRMLHHVNDTLTVLAHGIGPQTPTPAARLLCALVGAELNGVLRPAQERAMTVDPEMAALLEQTLIGLDHTLVLPLAWEHAASALEALLPLLDWEDAQLLGPSALAYEQTAVQTADSTADLLERPLVETVRDAAVRLGAAALRPVAGGDATTGAAELLLHQQTSIVVAADTDLLGAGGNEALWRTVAGTARPLLARGLADPAGVGGAVTPRVQLQAVAMLDAAAAAFDLVAPTHEAATATLLREALALCAQTAEALPEVDHPLEPAAVSEVLQRHQQDVPALAAAIAGDGFGTLGLPPQWRGDDLELQGLRQVGAGMLPWVAAGIPATLGAELARLMPLDGSGRLLLTLDLDSRIGRDSLGAAQRHLEILLQQRVDAPGVELQVGGIGLMWQQTEGAVGATVGQFLPLILLVVLLVLLVIFARVWDVVVVLGVLLGALAWTVGLAVLLGIALNPITLIVPILLVGLGVDYGIHAQVWYRDARAAGRGPRAAALDALTHASSSLVLATITAVFSFLTFLATPLPVLQQFGLLVALGLIGSLVLTLLLVPTLSMLVEGRSVRNPRPTKVRSRKVGHGPMGALLRTASARPVLTLGLVALLTYGAALSATTLQTSFTLQDMTAANIPVSRTIDEVDVGFPTSQQVALVVIEGRVDDPAVLQALWTLTQNVQDDGDLARIAGAADLQWVGSVVDDARAQQRLLGAAALLDAEPGVAALAAMADSLDTDGDGALLGDDNLSAPQAQLLVRLVANATALGGHHLVGLGTTGSPDLLVVQIPLLQGVRHGERILQHLQTDCAPLRALLHDGPLTGVTVTGLPLLNNEVMRTIQASGWRSAILTLVASSVVLTVFFALSRRSLTLGVVTVGPIWLDLIWLLGLMGALRLPLTMMTAMIVSMAVGLGDLYNVDFTLRFTERFRATKDPLKAMRQTLPVTGTALLGSAATTVLAFGVLVFAPVPVVQQFGTIFALAVALMFLDTLLVLPVLLVLWARWQPVARSA